MKPLLSLVMIVKNEAASIQEVLETAKEHVDRYTILDTGSSDDTVNIIRKTMSDMPGCLVHDTFKGYAESRNEALQIDRSESSPAVFQLMLSGDEYLRGGAKLRAYLELERDSKKDLHFLKLYIEDVLLPTPRVFRAGSRWKYDDFDCGVHEVPVYTKNDGTIEYGPNLSVPVGWTDGATIEHIVADPIKRLDTLWERHIPALEAALARNPNNARALEYLAQSYETLMKYVDADERIELAFKCLDIYHRRFELPFVHLAERNAATMRYLDDARFTDFYTPEQLFSLACKLCESAPKQPEAALIRADVATRVKGITAQKVYDLAADAARVATEYRLDNSLSVTISCAWKAHRLAAVAARQLARKHPEYAVAMRTHITDGLAAGGAWVLFKDIAQASDLETVPPTQEPTHTGSPSANSPASGGATGSAVP